MTKEEVENFIKEEKINTNLPVEEQLGSSIMIDDLLWEIDMLVKDRKVDRQSLYLQAVGDEDDQEIILRGVRPALNDELLQIITKFKENQENKKERKKRDKEWELKQLENLIGKYPLEATRKIGYEPCH